MTVRACYASTQETEAGGPGVAGQYVLHGGGFVGQPTVLIYAWLLPSPWLW